MRRLAPCLSLGAGWDLFVRRRKARRSLASTIIKLDLPGLALRHCGGEARAFLVEHLRGGVALGDPLGEPCINFIFRPCGRAFAKMDGARKFTRVDLAVNVLAAPTDALSIFKLGEL